MTRQEASLRVTVFSAADVPRLYKSREHWEQRFRILGLWPAQLAHESVAQRYSSQIDKQFLELQHVAVLNSDPTCVVGIAHAVPLRLEYSLEELPDTGWDWALKQAVNDQSMNVVPDCVCGLSISVLPTFQRRGVGARLIQQILASASNRGIQKVIMPIRPVLKEQWPLVPMHEFAAWRREDGLHQDPWIRAHERIGGRLQKVCSRSMTVVAPLKHWEQWCARTFVKSGNYVVKGSLAPVRIDMATGFGSYVEPNIWCFHASSRA